MEYWLLNIMIFLPLFHTKSFALNILAHVPTNLHLVCPVSLLESYASLIDSVIFSVLVSCAKILTLN